MLNSGSFEANARFIPVTNDPKFDNIAILRRGISSLIDVDLDLTVQSASVMRQITLCEFNRRWLITSVVSSFAFLSARGPT